MQDAYHDRRHGQALLAYRDGWRREDHHATRDGTTAIRRVQEYGSRRRHDKRTLLDQALWRDLMGSESSLHSEVFRNVGRTAVIGRTFPRGYTRDNVLVKFQRVH